MIAENERLGRITPSLTVSFLKKGLGELPGDYYRSARQAYEERDPAYAPGRGIRTYLSENWGKL